jgi:2-aminobenzoate-CoA ligase
VLVEDLGLVPGNRVLLRGGNSIGMALAWLAVVKAGLVAVATMPLLRAASWATSSTRRSRRWPVRREAAGGTAGWQARAPVLRAIVPFNADGRAGLAGRAVGAEGRRLHALPTAADDIALLAFTSGTTGKPKAAVHTHRDVLAACEAWPRHVLKATPDDIVVGSPPLAFTFGLGGLLVFPMWAGASVYYFDGPYTPEAWCAPSTTSAPPSATPRPPSTGRWRRSRASSASARLRMCVSAGEGLPDATRQLWKQATGIEMLDGIGATEMFHIFISSAGDDVRRGAIGKVVPGYRPRWSTTTARKCRAAPSASWPSSGPPAAATWTTRARPAT